MSNGIFLFCRLDHAQDLLDLGCAGWGVKRLIFPNIVMLHIKLKGVMNVNSEKFYPSLKL